ETDADERDWKANPTVLSGDIDGNDSGDRTVTDVAHIQGRNSRHVVTASGTDETAMLDGFTITAGYAEDNSTLNDGIGAGIYNDSGNASLTNLTISGN